MSSPKTAATSARKTTNRTSGKKAPTKAPPKLSARAPAKRLAGKAPATSLPAAATDAVLTADAKRLAAAIERSVAEGQPTALGSDALKALMGALCRAYSARVETGDDILPLSSRTAVSPTDVMRAASGLLRAADLQVFELGMWQSWTGR